MMAGANPAAVQRILRHSDPRITTEVYGHLAADYLRDEANRLRFFTEKPTPAVEPHVQPVKLQRAANSPPFADTLLTTTEKRDDDARRGLLT